MDPLTIALVAVGLYASGVATGALVVTLVERSRPNFSLNGGSNAAFGTLRIAPTPQSKIEEEAKKIAEREVFVPTKESRDYYKATRQRPQP